MGRGKKGAAVPSDAIDDFHDARDRRGADPFAQGDDDEEESQDEAVWDVGEDSEDDEDEEEEGEEEGEEDGAEEGEEEDDEEDDSDDENSGAWGGKRGDFHGGDVGDEAEADTSEEEEEELEVEKLQQKHADTLTDEDFMFGTLAQEQKKIKKQKKKSAEAKLLEAVGNELDDVDDDVTVESIAPDTTGMSEAALQKLVERQSPELVALLQEFIDQLTKLRQRVQPLMKSTLNDASAKGLSFLQVKNQLLLAYCTNVVFYTVLKASGRKTENHPVVKVLVELRTVLEKLKPIDSKLRYQVDKLLKMSTVGALRDQQDLISHKPNLDLAGADGADEPDKDRDFVNEEKFEEVDEQAEEELKSSKERRRKDKEAKGMERSGMMEEMRAELLDLPEESGVGGGRNREVDEEEAQKVRYEEETFTRRTETKKDRAKAKKANVEAFDPLADIAGLGGAFESLDGEDAENPVDKIMKRKSLKRQLRELGSSGAAQGSGDADLPYRAPHEKKHHYDGGAGNDQDEKHKNFGGFDDEEDGFDDDVVGNELYESIRSKGDSKKMVSMMTSSEMSCTRVFDP